MAKDIYHDLVKQALINEGWTITQEPIIQTFLKRHNVKLILFDTESPIINAWKK